jgi:hypothetical protein
LTDYNAESESLRNLGDGERLRVLRLTLWTFGDHHLGHCRGKMEKAVLFLFRLPVKEHGA